MEEILQSIRRIIAEEEEEPKAAPKQEQAPPKPAAAPAKTEDVLELTEVVQDDGSVVDVKNKTAPQGDVMRDIEALTKVSPPPAPPPAAEDTRPKDFEFYAEAVKEKQARQPEPPPPPRDEMPMVEAMTKQRPPAREEDDANELLSHHAAEISAAAIRNLKQSVLRAEEPHLMSPEFRSGATVEDLVREALRPMLKDWLDANLPQIVEGIVEKEIKKIVD